MTLFASEITKIGSADRGRIVQALADFKRSGRQLWLSASNAFPTGVPPRSWPRARRDATSLLELIAVSGPNHCADGWGFLARSLAALIAGDMHAARHFAYYAQLRASLAILACEGIGVFDGVNCVATSSGRLIQIDEFRRPNRPLGTHAMAWLALHAWANGGAAGAAIGNAITIRKVSIDSCLRSMWPGTAGRPVAHELILAWGVDLQRAIDDRQARNVSSYTAQALNPLQQNADDTVQFLAGFWDAFEPEPGDPFLAIDRHLFRLTVETQHRNINPTTMAAQLAADIAARYANLEPIIQATITDRFLARQDAVDDLLIIRSARSRSNPSHPTEMISRGALLLRTATALVTRVLFDAGITASPDLDFWLLALGSNLGFWDRSGPPSPMQGLWDDVSEALDDVLNTQSVSPSPFDRFEWATRKNGLPRVFEAERIALWGLRP